MKWLSRLIKVFTFFLILIALAGAGALVGAYLYLEPKLPSIEHLSDIELQVPLRIYTKDHKLIGEYGEKRRVPLAYEDIPQKMVHAILASEDDRFFEHPGVDYQGLLRAASQLALTGKRKQGGSTITMQVARNFFLTREKTYTRKLTEILLALKIEKELSKEQILELYLNKIYLGNRAYGVGAAAQVYYGKPINQLDLAQIAMIAGLPKAPSRYNPIAGPERAKLRRNYVLGRMLQIGRIDASTHQEALKQPLTAAVHFADVEIHAPFVAEMIRAKIYNRYGTDAYNKGYSAFATIDSRLQVAANQSIRHALQAYDKRHGYRGPAGHVELAETDTSVEWDVQLGKHKTVAKLIPGLVIDITKDTAKIYLGEGQEEVLTWQGLSWANPFISETEKGAAPKKTSDVLQLGDLIYLTQSTDKKDQRYWRLAQIPIVEGALVAVDPTNGAITSLAGGYDYYQSKFNRVTQAKRQPGSGFKAFIYSAALENGFTPASLINDAPVVFDDPGLESTWRPENYSGRFYGQTRLRLALTKSRNLVSIRLLRTMGINKALQHVKNFGFDIKKLPRDLSLALGSGAITPLQMAEGYAILANGGFHVKPYIMERIEDGHGEIAFEAEPMLRCDEQATALPTDESKNCAPRVISPQNHYLMNSMMRDVVQYGTARRAKVLGRQDIAGKTGTTNEQRDAWFNGFHPTQVAIAWVGFDSSKPLGKGEVGGRAALPAWIEYMRTALDGVEEKALELPEGMVMVRIDPKTGLLARAGQRNAIFEVFRTENEPSPSEDLFNPEPSTPGNTGQEEPSEDLF